MSRRRLLAAVLVLAAAGGGWWAYRARSKPPEDLVSVAVERGTVRRTVSATGTIKAVVTVQVGSQVTGVVEALLADFNSIVKAGQVIARIDPSTFRAQLARAQADLVAARANLEGARADQAQAEAGLKRTADLASRNIISARDLEVAQATAVSARARAQAAAAQVEQAKASVTVAEVNIEHTVITSPIDGVVISRSVDVGQTVAASLSAPTIFVIANDLSQMHVIASVDEADIGSVSDETRVSFTVDAFSGETFRGRIHQVRLEPLVTQNVVTYSVIIEVSNADRKLRPGMTANVTMTVAEAKDVLKVPNAALRFWPDGVPREKMQEILGGDAPAAAGKRGATAEETAQASGTPSAGAAAAETDRARRRASWRERRDGGTGRESGSQAEETTDRRSPAARAVAAEVEGAGGAAAELSFPPPPPPEPRPRVVWVTAGSEKPQPRKVLVTITDGSVSAVVGGDLKEGERVVTAKTGGAGPAPAARPNNPFAPAAPGGGGGGRGRR